MVSRRQGEGGWKFPDGSVEHVPVADGGVLHALQPAASPPHPDAAHRPQPVLQAEELQDGCFLRSTPAGTGAQARRRSAGWFAQQIGMLKGWFVQQVGMLSRLVCSASWFAQLAVEWMESYVQPPSSKLCQNWLHQ